MNKSFMDKKTVVVGVGGGIAAYKAATLVSLLGKHGYDVQVLMTENATKFIQPLTFQALTKHPVVVDTFHEPDVTQIAHIAIADSASLYVIAPATANVIAKLAHGLADDMVTTTALAATCPLLIAPAMNVHMFEHPAVKENLATLVRRGATVIDPASGPLACGYTGKGRLAEPEDVAAVIDAILSSKQDMKGLKIVVTAGPTIEDLDPVRYLSNASTGKMGYAIAAAAKQRGADVTLVSGPTHLAPVSGVTMLAVRSTEDMLRAVDTAVRTADVLITAAAPADFRPRIRHEHKWKKSEGIPSLELEPTPDVLLTVSQTKQPHQTFVGFAAETKDLITHSIGKLERKRLDLLVANDVSEVGSGFAVDTNRVVLLRPNDAPEQLPLMSKQQVAEEILNQVVKIRQSQGLSGT